MIFLINIIYIIIYPKRNLNPDFIKYSIRAIFLSAGAILFHNPPIAFIGKFPWIKDQLHFINSSKVKFLGSVGVQNQAQWVL